MTDAGVPLLDFDAHHGPLLPELEAAFARVARHGKFILGPEVDAFEKEILATVGAKHAVGVSSGTDALLVALMALGIGKDDEVITTSFSFFATAGCIARVGATPRFVDIDPRTYNMDPAHLESAITAKTKAIMPVHLFGQTADMIAIKRIADARGIPIIEDAAQAIGAVGRAGTAGTIGAIGCFSFFPSKNLGCFGDGGLVTTDSAEEAEHLRILRAHGGKPKYYHREIGGNFRLDALQAAILRVKLPHLAGWQKRRQENADLYDRLFADARIPTELFSTPARVEPGHAFNQYVIRTPKRDALRDHLTKAGIGTEIYYPVPLHVQECFKYLNVAPEALPHSQRAAAEVLALPIFPELGPERVQRVARAVISFIQQ